MGANEDLDALLSRAQQGDVRAFETVLASHLPRIRRFARAFVSSPDEADDLAQEAVIKVYKSLRLFRYQSSFSSWLFAVVRNAFFDVAKSRQSQERRREETIGPEHTEVADPAPSAEGRLVAEQERAALWAQIRQLPLEFRTAVVLFDVEGHSYDEIATIEGVSIGTVKSRISRGRERLRRLLGAAAPEPGTSGEHTSSQIRRSS